MTAMFSVWTALLFLPVFFLAVGVSFFLPGFFLLRKTFQKSPLSLFLSSMVLGIVVWGMQGYIFGYLHVRFLTYVYVLSVVAFAYIHRYVLRDYFLRFWKDIRQLPKILFFIVLLGVIVQLIPVAGSGMLYKDGVRFYSINGTDGIMHLAYIQSITHAFPPMEPGAHGDLVTNYHYWSDLVISEIARIWLLPIPHLYFRYFPLLISILTGLLAYVVLIDWGGGVIAGLWGAFFIYFSGDAPFLFSILHKSFGFNTPAIDNGALQFINMPHAMSRMLFLGGLLVFSLALKQATKRHFLYSILIFASLIGFKVYFGLFTALGLCFVFAGRFLSALRKPQQLFSFFKREWAFLGFLLIFFAVELSIFLPPNKSAGGLYFSALDWPRLLLGAGGVDLTVWWKFYRLAISHNQQVFVVLLDAIAVVFSLIIIYGTRVVGLLPSKKTRHLPAEMLWFLVPGMIIFNLLGLFTLQVSGGLNVFNFFAVATVPLMLFAAFFLEEVMQKKQTVAFALAVIVVMLTVPRSFFEDGYSFYRYFTAADSYLVSNDELAGLAYIRTHAPAGTLVQSHPMNHWDMRAPYVAFFTDHDTYLSGIGIQETHNQPIAQKKAKLDFIFTAPNSYDLRSKLIQNGITYFFWQKNNEEVFQYIPTRGHFSYVFENKSVAVLVPNK